MFQILSSFKDSPSPYYAQFMQRLVHTVRYLPTRWMRLLSRPLLQCILPLVRFFVMFRCLVLLLRCLPRDEVAECSSTSYENLSLDSLQRMMMFSSREELLTYIAETRVRPRPHAHASTHSCACHHLPPPPPPVASFLYHGCQPSWHG